MSQQMQQQLYKMIQSGTPETVASKLLTHYQGRAREAEVECWKLWDAAVGGEPGRRPEEGLKSPEATFINHVIRCIVDGSEEPKVERFSSFQRIAA